MQFGLKPVTACAGAILAHSLRVEGRLLKKGYLLSASDIETLERAGHLEITVATLEEGDIGENDAAAEIAVACANISVRVGASFTGRANLYSAEHGVALIDEVQIASLNAVDESITVATIAPFTRVVPRQMLATVKIIPFAVPGPALAAARLSLEGMPAVRVAPLAPKSAALISTSLPHTPAAILDKNRRALDRRLEALGSKIVLERRVAHRSRDVAGAIADAFEANADPILVFGASAITDRNDVVPAGIVEAGGTIGYFGMPVDPGNLLLLARLGGATIIGLPGCARSPKRNGFDFVLERLLANIPVGGKEIAAMGVGGLLAEIPTRPQLRDKKDTRAPHGAPSVSAIVLAAGVSSRMGRNKLVADIHGKPLIRRVVEAAVNSHADRVIVVTGNEGETVRTALKGLAVAAAANPDFRSGLSSSLKTGIRALEPDCDGAIVLLGDMPDVSTRLIDTLIAAFDPQEGRAICVAAHLGKRGNPVLWARRFFPDILALEGDVGAKHLIAIHDELVCEIETGDESPLIDIDTPEALAAYAARPQ